MFRNARCGMLCLIHPNVAAMWNKVRLYNQADTDVQYGVASAILWNVRSEVRCDVEWWCGRCGI